MIPSSKHSKEFNGVLTRFLGGLNKSLPPQAIDAEELIDATNFFYDSTTGYLTSREGLKRLSANNVPAGIYGGYDFVKDGVSHRLLVSQEAPLKLYELDGANLPVYIGDLTGERRPSFATINGQCIIASGGRLQVYDGLVLSAITMANGFPADAPILDFITDIAEANIARVIGCGNTAERDRLHLSGIKDGTWWKRDSNGTPESDAKYLDAGFGDGQDLIGIGTFQKDAILFKRTPSASHRALYRGMINGTVSSWACPRFRRMHSALSAHMIKDIGESLLFVDIEGPKALKVTDLPTDEIPYSVAPASKTIGGEMAKRVASDGFIILDPIKAIAMIRPSRNYDYFYCLDIYRDRWTYFKFAVDILSGWYCDGKMYFGGGDGYVYEYDADLSKDNDITYPMTVETKWFDIFPLFKEIIKEKYINLLGLSDGTGSMTIKKKGAMAYQKPFNFAAGWWDWDRVNAIAPVDWTEELSKSPLYEYKDVNIVDGDYVSFVISINSGRAALSYFATRTAQVERS